MKARGRRRRLIVEFDLWARARGLEPIRREELFGLTVPSLGGGFVDAWGNVDPANYAWIPRAAKIVVERTGGMTRSRVDELVRRTIEDPGFGDEVEATERLGGKAAVARLLETA